MSEKSIKDSNKSEGSSSKTNELKNQKELQEPKPFDITLEKSYKVPNAQNQKNFNKINTYNFVGILKCCTFFEIAEFSFVNQKFYNIIHQKYPKRIPMIKSSIITYNKNIIINFPEDFKYYFLKNGRYIRKIIKDLIKNRVCEYCANTGAKKFFFENMKVINPLLSKVRLDNCEIGKKSMKYLCHYLSNPNSKITEININNNKLTGDLLKPLTYNSNLKLKKIKADKCLIDSKSLNCLSNINMKLLSLKNDNIDNDLIANFTNNNINKLDLSFNNISNDGFFYICKNLPNLTKLNLSNNNICDLSMAYISLYIKEKNCQLVSLNLKENKITISGAITLISTLDKINTKNKEGSTLKKLNLSGNLLDLVSIPKRLGTDFYNVNLYKISLSNHSFTINDLNVLLDFINNIKCINVLDLSKINFDNVSLNFVFNKVSENNSLKKLKLRNCYLGNTELNDTLENYYTKHVKKIPTSKNEDIPHSETKDIINSSKLNNIINNTENNDKINNEKNIEINNKINVINIEDNISEKDKIIDNKRSENNQDDINNKFLGVESLDLGFNFINYQKLDKIILSNHIKKLNIEGNDLHLWGNDIYLFFDFIINNKVLEELNLDKNNLQKIANKLLEKINNNIMNKKDCSLKHLSLADNQITDINLELTNLLSNNKNLENINLKNNLIGDEIGNNYFFHSLFKSKKSKIKNIFLTKNKITLTFIEKIIKYIQENTIEKKDFILNVNSKELRESYLNLNLEDKKKYEYILNLNNIICF